MKQQLLEVIAGVFAGYSQKGVDGVPTLRRVERSVFGFHTNPALGPCIAEDLPAAVAPPNGLFPLFSGALRGWSIG